MRVAAGLKCQTLMDIRDRNGDNPLWNNSSVIYAAGMYFIGLAGKYEAQPVLNLPRFNTGDFLWDAVV